VRCRILQGGHKVGAKDSRRFQGFFRAITILFQRLSQHNLLHLAAFKSIFGRPFVKRFALCYRTVVLSALSVTLVYCGQTVGWIKMKLGVQVGLGSDHIVLDGDPAPPPPKGHSPPIFGHICCGQMDGWIKMPLGMEVGLSLGDCVRWGPCSPLPKKGAVPPIFGPSLLWPNGCMYQDTAWYRGRPQPRRHCVRWGPNSLP